MLTLGYTWSEVESVGCFELRTVKIDSAGCIDFLADTVRTCVVIVWKISLVPVVDLWNSSHF